MGRHFREEMPSADEYYRNRIEGLEKVNEGLRNKVEMQAHYISRLEQERTEVADRIERLEKALVEASIR